MLALVYSTCKWHTVLIVCQRACGAIFRIRQERKSVPRAAMEVATVREALHFHERPGSMGTSLATSDLRKLNPSCDHPNNFRGKDASPLKELD